MSDESQGSERGVSEDKGTSHSDNLMYLFVLLFNRTLFGSINEMKAGCVHLRHE